MRGMHRREFLAMMASTAAAAGRVQPPLVVPVRIILDGKVKWRPDRIGSFWWHIWPQAVREFGSCGIRLQSSLGSGEVGRPPSREPVLTGLEHGTLNLVITDRLPMEWDQGRALSGVTTLYRGFHVCMLAWAFAHVNQIPLVSVNTCVHEMLHALMHDIYENRPSGVSGALREFRIDWYATRLWLLRDGAAIRKSAESYLDRLKQDARRYGPTSSTETL